MTFELKATARNVFRVLETGNVSLAGTTVGPTFLNREASVSPTAASLPGPAGLLASSAWMRSAFSNLRFEITDEALDGDRVYLRLRMRGTHTGAFVQFKDGKLAQAVAPTGKDINFEQIHVLTFENGLVVGHEAVRDDVTMLGQLGVFPPSPAVGIKLVAWKISGKDKRAAEAVSHAADQAAAAVTATA